MKRVGKPVFFIVVIIIAAITTLSFTGVYQQYGDLTRTYVKGASDIRWGIDIRGGVDVTFSPPEGYDATQTEMAAAESIIKTRLVNQNITDYEVYTDTDRDRIIVRFPWRSDEENFDAAAAIDELGTMALLTFREGAEYDADGPSGRTAENVVLEGSDVQSASAAYGPVDNSGSNVYYVQLTLTDAGAQKFADATSRLMYDQISIWMDDVLISAPYVENTIDNGMAMITGSFDAASATQLADQINGGALPFQLMTQNYSTISPTLGEGARDAMLLAGIIAFVLVAIFMIFMYRLPGFVACIGLLGQLGLLIASLTGFFPFMSSFTLTLPGIAGIILSIGFGVDANVITAERIKEELRLGKSVDGAVQAGFSRAFTAILDGNLTVIIVSIILLGAFGPPGSFFSKLLSWAFWMFGPTTAGNIYSFGYTLLMGVLFNFVMGIFACRLMQRSLAKFKAFRKPWLFGGEKA